MPSKNHTATEEVTAQLTPIVIRLYLDKFVDVRKDPDMKASDLMDMLIAWDKDGGERRKKTMEVDIDADIDVDVDIDIDDVESYIDWSSTNAREVADLIPDDVLRAAGGHECTDRPYEVITLEDELKERILAKAMEKYTIDELEHRLALDWSI